MNLNNEIKKLVDDNLLKESKKLEEINKEITVYISFFSLAKSEPWEYSPLEKSFKFLKNLKKCYILATRESINDANKEKETLLMKNSTLDIKIIEISSDNYESIYATLEKDILGDVLDLEKFTRNNLLIDNTLGHKMISAVLYKFSVEQGIKLINWQNDHIRDKDSRIRRVPGSDKLNFLEFPQLKNFTVVSKINSLIENFKFNEAKNLCTAINNIERAELLTILSDIFNVDNMINLGEFIESIENINEQKFNISTKKSLEILDRIKKISKIILDLDAKDLDPIGKIIHILIFCYFIKYYFLEKPYNAPFKVLLVDKLIEEVEDEGYDTSVFELGKINIYESIDDIFNEIKEDFEKILKINKIDKNPDDILESSIAPIFTNFDLIIEDLVIPIPKVLLIENGILKIKKYNIEIPLEKEFKNYLPKKTSVNANILGKIIDSKEYKITKNELNSLAKNEEEFSGRNFNALKDYLKEFNRLILKTLKERGVNVNSNIIPLEIKGHEVTFQPFKEFRVSDEYII